MKPPCFDDVNLTEMCCNSHFSFSFGISIGAHISSASEPKECYGQFSMPPRSSPIFLLIGSTIAISIEMKIDDKSSQNRVQFSSHRSQLKKITTMAYRIHFNWLLKVKIYWRSVETKFVWFRSLCFISGKQSNCFGFGILDVCGVSITMTNRPREMNLTGWSNTSSKANTRRTHAMYVDSPAQRIIFKDMQ